MSIGGLVARAALSLTPWGRVLSAFRWVAENWKAIAVAVAFAVLGFLYISALGDGRHWRKESDRYQGLFRDEKAAFKQIVANYRLATEKARGDDLANARRVEAAQAAISSEVSHDYQIRIADLRTRYDALRLRRAPAIGVTGNRGGGDGTGLSAPAGSASGADAAADQEGLLGLDDRLTCSLQAEQLDALIDWEEKQLAVPR